MTPPVRPSRPEAANITPPAGPPAKIHVPEKEALSRRFRQWLRDLLFFQSGELKEAIADALEETPAHPDQLPPEEKTMLKNLLDFSEKAVKNIMVPRGQIQAVEYGISLEEMKKIVSDKSHTRIPIYKETLDNVKGFIHVKDLFPIISGDAVYDMALLLRDVLFVSPSMKVLDLLVKMRLSRVHMAIVVDEYGGTDGLITMEDLFEQIFGEIHDEHDEGERDVLRWSSQNTVEVDARVEVARLERELGITLHDENEEAQQYDTLGGLIFFLSGRVPTKGEKIAHTQGITFEILDGDARRIKRVRILYRPVAAQAV